MADDKSEIEKVQQDDSEANQVGIDAEGNATTNPSGAAPGEEQNLEEREDGKAPEGSEYPHTDQEVVGHEDEGDEPRGNSENARANAPGQQKKKDKE